jgi:hypothetical protein
LTPNYYSSAPQILTEAGLEKEGVGDSTKFEELLRRNHFHFALIHKNRPASDFIGTMKEAQLMECFAERCLYRFRPAP